MGLIGRVVALPLAPITGVLWLAEKLQEIAETEMHDPAALRRHLTTAEADHAAGLISDAELSAIQDAIVERLLESGDAPVAMGVNDV
jgi:hypothetical protein